MRVAINALAAKGEGALTNLINIVPEILRVDTSLMLIVYVNAQTAEKIAAKSFDPCRLELKVIPGLDLPEKRILWEQFLLQRFLDADKIDVLYAPIPPVPLFCSIPTVVIIQNMEPYCPHVWPMMTLREQMRNRYLRLATAWSLRHATRVVLLSEASRELLLVQHGSSSAPIDIVYNGRDPAFFQMPKAQAKRTIGHRFGINRPFILYVSKTRPYKNHIELVEALGILHGRWKRLESLVIAGEKQEPYYARIRKCVTELGLADFVYFLGNVDYENLPALYNAAEVVVFPSTCEACPNIAIESLACGVPMAVSNIPVLQELCGDSVSYFDPFDPESIAQTILELLTKPDRRGELGSKALQRANRFSWTETARQTLEVIRQAADIVK